MLLLPLESTIFQGSTVESLGNMTISVLCLVNKMSKAWNYFTEPVKITFQPLSSTRNVTTWEKPSLSSRQSTEKWLEAIRLYPGIQVKNIGQLTSPWLPSSFLLISEKSSTWTWLNLQLPATLRKDLSSVVVISAWSTVQTFKSQTLSFQSVTTTSNTQETLSQAKPLLVMWRADLQQKNGKCTRFSSRND